MTRTLLVDGNNLLKIGIHGVKDFFHKNEHVGGIWHFVNTLRRFIDEYNYDKVVVFWDGQESVTSRKKIYPQYKENRRTEYIDETQTESFVKQRERIKEYLEEMFVRQIDIQGNEADDLIAYYCQISIDERKTIFSGDRDLTQLISEQVCIYSPNTKKFYYNGDKVKLHEYEFPHYNIMPIKVLTGDKSDNIDGIYYLGEKTLVKFFPEVLESKINISDILTKAEQLLKENKSNTVLQNLLSGKTKTGIYGQEFFEVNEKIVDLSKPLLTDEGKSIVELYYRETLDPDGRGYKNLIKMMMENGFFKFLPKKDDAWTEFIRPFLKLTRKEKRNFNTQKK
jgi:5'-3' exonuclease